MKLNCKTVFRLGSALLVAWSASLTARADYQSTVLSQNPAGYWRLNETVQPSTSYATNSGSLGVSAQGSFVSLPSLNLPGPFAGSVAVGVDGTAQYVLTPWVDGLNTASFTAEVWVNPAENPKFGYVMSSGQMTAPRTGWYLAQDDGSVFLLGNSYVFRTFINSGTTPGVTVTAPVNPAGTWLHLVVSYDAGTSTSSIYTNGVLAMSAVGPHVANASGPTTVGCRSSLANFWPGKAAEMAMYGSALSPTQIAAHYTAATTSPATYAATVLADAPLLYHRYQAPPQPIAANLGTIGSAGNGLYLADSIAGASGPKPARYPGFDAANKSPAFVGGGGAVRLPPFNFNTNTLTISGWVNASNLQKTAAGIVVSDAGTAYAGLTIDAVSGGLGLGYVWNNDANTYNWSPTTDAGLTQLPDSDWAFVALVVQPTEAEIYIATTNNPASFTSVTNYLVHVNQSFDGATLIGTDAGLAAYSFNGAIDEVAIWNRSLSSGELYTQYASAVGGVKPRIFTDLQGPVGDVAAGDPIVLTVDAGGTPDLTFTWHKVGVGTIATTTNGMLTIASSVLTDTGTYDVTISNGAGTADSQQVAITVITPSTPGITGLEGFQNRTLYLGATLRLAVVGTGGGLKYQWYKNAAPIPSATSSVYSVGVTNTSQAGSFSVSVTNSVGTTTSGPPVVITIPNMASNSYEGVVISSGPEAWWRLDESAGSTNLFDGMGRHDGTYTNLLGTSPPVALGVPGALVGNTNTGASFSGDQGLGVIPFSPALSPAKFTIEGWVRTTVTDDPNLSPFSSNYGADGEYWRTAPAGEWRPYSGAGSAPLKDNGQTNAVVVQNQWTYLVVAYDSSVAGFPWIYAINGWRATTSWSGSGPNLAGPIIIGGAGVNATTLAQYFWKGQVDEVAIYPRVLSNAEIAAHYAARGVEILPPTFSGPLLSQTVTTGKLISFSTSVFGTSPTLYWYKGTPQASTPIATGTNAFWINPTALTDTGTYSLVASNSVGMVTNTTSLTVISPVGHANVTNNLVLHLTFDTDTTDSSGRGNDGTPSSASTATSAPTFVPGIIGSQALQYATLTTNGSGTAVTNASYVTLGAISSGPPADLQFGAGTSFTIGLWVKQGIGALPGDLPFIGTATNSANDAGWLLAPTYQTGGWQWGLNDGVGVSGNNVGANGPGNSINDGAWHNFVLTVDRSAAVADSYLDGVHVASKSITLLGSIDNNNTWPIVIGQTPIFVYPEPGSATVDDIGIWRRALSPLEVAQVESAGSTAGRSFNTVAPPSVTLTIAPSGGNLILNYTSGTLLQSSNLGPSAVWLPVPGASPPSTTVTPTNAANFYRVLLD